MRIWQIIETPKGRLSSKRVCGVLGWLVLLVGFMVLLFVTKEAPSFTEFLICAIVALLGVDSVTDTFKKENNGEDKS